MSKLIMIAAIGNNNVIGNDNKLLWKLKTDLNFFKNTTIESPVIMGRKTYESIGRPLPKRTNIILTRNKSFNIEHPNVVIFNGICNIINYSDSNGHDLYIIGGSKIYNQFLPYCDELLISHVDCNLSGDTYFPSINYNDLRSEKLLDIKKSDIDEYDFKTIRYYLK